MYHLSANCHRLTEAPQCSFSDLNLDERHYLQEWIADQPNVLGESLLIIAKEFDKFLDTNDRLDLLALDSKGHLVVIENKIDDSGKDVVGQALKYASFCSEIPHQRIIELYADYVGSKEIGEEDMCAFFKVDGISKIPRLNPPGTQRMIIVAGKFRREATSSALWLRQRGINIDCIEVILHKDYESRITVTFRRLPLDPENENLKVHINDVPIINTKGKKLLAELRRGFIELNKRMQGPFEDCNKQGFWPILRTTGLHNVRLAAHINLSGGRLIVEAVSGDLKRDRKVMKYLKNHYKEYENEFSDFNHSWKYGGKTKAQYFVVTLPGIDYREHTSHNTLYFFLIRAATIAIRNFVPLLKKMPGAHPCKDKYLDAT